MKKSKRLRIYAFLITLGFVGLFFIFIVNRDSNLWQDRFNEDEVEEAVESAEQPRTINVWVPYWDYTSAMEELVTYADYIDSLCYFSAYFDEEGHLLLENATTLVHDEMKQNVRLKDKRTYLTIVNDQLNSEGELVSKDTELLGLLLTNRQTMESHADEIVQMALDYGYDGVELDYEELRQDQELWSGFVELTQILWDKCQDSGLDMHVVLMPGFPVDYDWPEGPQYVVMCYNLHGKGTEAGPRADREFIEEMIAKMERMPGPVGFGLATGGYDFCEDGNVEGVTRNTAEKRLHIHKNLEAERDEASQQLYFTYWDADKAQHTLWYADEQTLEYWSDIIRDAGFDSITIFRAGGNELDHTSPYNSGDEETDDDQSGDVSN